MTLSSPALLSLQNDRVRPPSVVMDLERLGCAYPTRISFMRSLVRKIHDQKWIITSKRFNLNQDGMGEAVYDVQAKFGQFSFVVFTNYLDAENRSDRVIAEQWDMTATLCAGTVDDQRLEQLRRNVPLQEKGRVDATCIVLTRANKSVRNFEYVVSQLASGRQPAPERLAKVGYLYRTTAVYGSGKFGLADWRKVTSTYPDFASPFCAEMFACFLIRQFSIDQANHIAKSRSENQSVSFSPVTEQYIGIGNATGLGMAPYLINHPLLINRWLEVREGALADIVSNKHVTSSDQARLFSLLKKTYQHFEETDADGESQQMQNTRTMRDIAKLIEQLDTQNEILTDWQQILNWTREQCSVDAQELFVSLIMELYPDIVDTFDSNLCVEEDYNLDPSMLLTELQHRIETAYHWAINTDFSVSDATSVFWYRSEEKMEPRLGERGSDPGEQFEMFIDVCREVCNCYEKLVRHLKTNQNDLTADFVAQHPECRAVVRRIQTMSQTKYGEIRANLIDRDVLPIHLLRCKLAFFGVSKFSPRSRFWVRNTMFQGAPTVRSIAQDTEHDWCFPVMPRNDECAS